MSHPKLSFGEKKPSLGRISLEPISKMHLVCNRRILAAAAFSKLIVFIIRIVSAAAASLRNSLDFAFKAIFEIGSKNNMQIDFKKQGATLIIALGVILGLVAYAGTIFFKEKAPNQMPAVSPTPSAVIQIDFNNGQKRAFEGELDGGVYPLNLVLQSIAEEGGFSISVKQGAIEHIAGVSGPWKIYQNGAALQNPPESLAITGGDYYVLKKE